ncbi:hypothetical protein TNCV_4185511 [Trichonephila clavipes]|nr:hypothetical protein TNCV_4185511 [Trichonephila clavipes]
MPPTERLGLLTKKDLHNVSRDFKVDKSILHDEDSNRLRREKEAILKEKSVVHKEPAELVYEQVKRNMQLLNNAINIANAEQIKRIDQDVKNLLQFMDISPFCSSLPSIQHFPANKNIVQQRVKQKLANDTTRQEDYNCEKRGSPYREMPPYHNSTRRLQLREKEGVLTERCHRTITRQEDYNCEKRGSPYREMPPYHNSSRRLQLREKRESLQRDATVPCKTRQEDYNCEKRGSPYREMPPYHNSSRRLQLREKRESLQRDATVPCKTRQEDYNCEKRGVLTERCHRTITRQEDYNCEKRGSPYREMPPYHVSMQAYTLDTSAIENS